MVKRNFPNLSRSMRRPVLNNPLVAAVAGMALSVRIRALMSARMILMRVPASFQLSLLALQCHPPLVVPGRSCFGVSRRFRARWTTPPKSPFRVLTLPTQARGPHR